MSNPALILVDIQRDYFAGGRMALEGAEAAADNAAALLARFRERGWPLVHVQHLSVRSNATFFLPGTEGIEFHPKVAPRAGESVIEKNFPNAFRATQLDTRLRSLGVTELVFAGMMTHMCIDTSVRAAFDLGFKVELAHDACATRALKFGTTEVPAPQVHAAALAALNGTYARVVPVGELLEELK